MDVLGRARGGDAHGDAARENLHEASRGVDEHGRDGVRRVPLAGGFRGVVERVVFEREGAPRNAGRRPRWDFGTRSRRGRRSVGPRERAPRVRADVRAVAAGRGDDLEVRGAGRAGGGVSTKRGGDERRDVLVLGEAAAGSAARETRYAAREVGERDAEMRTRTRANASSGASSSPSRERAGGGGGSGASARADPELDPSSGEAARRARQVARRETSAWSASAAGSGRRGEGATGIEECEAGPGEASGERRGSKGTRGTV